MGSIKISRLLEDRDFGLQLTLVAGAEGLDRRITSPRIQKPGLALAGFTEHLHPERVQVFGNTEVSYLETLTLEEQQAALEKILSDTEIACVVVTKDLPAPPPLVEACQKTGLPLMKTPLMSSVFIEKVTAFLEEALTEATSLHGVLMDVFGVGNPVIKHHMEIRGLGIINIKDLFGVAAVRDRKKVELVIELVEWDPEQEYDRLGLKDRFFSVLGVDLPLATLPVRPGRNLTTLI